MIRPLMALLVAIPVAAGPLILKVHLTEGDGGGTVSMPLEKYVAAVLGGECGVFRSDEALKAMALAARTYAVRLRGRHSAEGFDFCGTTHCQRIDVRAVTPRLLSITEETAGELLWFEGKPALTSYAQDCAGATEDASEAWPDQAISYLRSHADPYCTRSGISRWQWIATPQEVAGALRQSGLRAPAVLREMTIAQRTASGRARTLALTGGGESIAVSASSFRFAVGRTRGWNTLRSGRFEVRNTDGRFIFEGSGAGHGVGLCQRGADRMGVEGHSYREILAFYYPGTVAGLTARGLRWVRLSGENLVVLTTQPDRDGAMLSAAQRVCHDLADRVNLPFPPSIEIRVYPDVETFRNATGEPGWVAAYTSGSRIRLQPEAVLGARAVFEQTLRHEFLHVLVENQAAPGLPVWFREGLVGYLEHSYSGERTASANSEDADLQQLEDAARARRAYAQATGRVRALVHRYGESAVLSWLKRGLPPELKNTSSSQATTNSR